MAHEQDVVSGQWAQASFAIDWRGALRLWRLI
jgi:hypothetical protein